MIFKLLIIAALIALVLILYCIIDSSEGKQ